GETEAVERAVAALPAPYAAPRGALWIAWDGNAAVGCLALQPLGTDTAELKRMYVAPQARGRGVARRLTEHAIAVAAARGYARLRLGTLPTMRAAQRLYTSVGVRRIAPYRQGGGRGERVSGPTIRTAVAPGGGGRVGAQQA